MHKPKPIRTWREFFTEIGVIVLGVLIALGLEQAMEALHWSYRVRDAETAMRAELDQGDRDAWYRSARRCCWIAARASACSLRPTRSTRRWRRRASLLVIAFPTPNLKDYD